MLEALEIWSSMVLESIMLTLLLILYSGSRVLYLRRGGGGGGGLDKLHLC